jgi:SAM-dependent methyltransferase
METKSIDEVRNFWESHPLHTIEFQNSTPDKDFFESADKMRWSDNEKWAEKDFYNFENPGSLLDAGCGIGVFTRYYARKGFQVTAVDLTQNALDFTNKSLSLYNLNAQVHLASVESLPFKNNSFDYVVSNGVIHHTPNPAIAAKEFLRVLKPNGIASVAIYYKNALLRQPLWPISKLALRVLLKKSWGREKMLSIHNPDDLAKVYDGNETPIAFIYTKKEATKLFDGFEVLKCEPHSFPLRFLKFGKPGGIIHSILDKNFGFLIYFLLRKPG